MYQPPDRHERIIDQSTSDLYADSWLVSTYSGRGRLGWTRTLAMLRYFRPLLTLAAFSSLCCAADFYYAQTAQGSNDGTSCSNAYAYTNGTNGINVAGKWVAGNVLHICGTITLGANATFVTSAGNGSSGNPITLKWETGAVLTAPYWNTSAGGIAIQNNYVTVDGGTNGLMTATANGDSLANQQGSTGINVTGSNIEIMNLTGTNLYQRNNSNGSGGSGTTWINFNPDVDHVKVHNCSLSNSRLLIFLAYNTVTDVQVYNNTLDYSSWMIVMGDNNSGSAASGVIVHDNSLGPHFNIWLDTAQTMHADGIDLFAVNSGSTFTASVYNNYTHGDMCSTSNVNCTAYIYIDGGHHNTVVFNNVLVQESGAGSGPEALLVMRGEGNTPTNNSVYNNTFVASPQGSAIGVKTDTCCGGGVGTGQVYENNVFYNLSFNYVSGPNSWSQVSTANHNDYYNYSSFAAQNVSVGQNLVSWASWQGLGHDANGTIGNPNLSGSYTLQTGSAAIGAGANLTSLGIAALDSDAAGRARPSSAAWDAGAYQHAGVVMPPTSLTADVH